MPQWSEIRDRQLLEAYRKIPGRVLVKERWFAERETAGDLFLKTTVQFQATQHQSCYLTLNLYELAADAEFYYYLPLLITTEPPGERNAYFGHGAFYFYDGIPTTAYLELINELLISRRPIAALLGDGEFQFQTTPDLMTPRFQLGNSSSNSLLFVSHQYLLKNYRRVYPGINPELRLGLALTAAHADCVPPIWGSISCKLDHVIEYTLGLFQETIDHQGTGWMVWGKMLADPNALHCAELERQATELGRVLAALHRKMAGIAAEDARGSVFNDLMLQERINKLTATVGRELSAVNPDLIPRILDKINRIKDEINTDAGLGRLFRIHGDLHLEQVLKTAFTWKVIDFEGEPLKSIAEREAPDSPLKDVASLLRSVGYRVHIATGGTTDLESRLQMALLNGYREYQNDFLPTNVNFEPLLNLFQLERVIYELSYEAKYRPEWLSIPLAGLEQLLGR